MNGYNNKAGYTLIFIAGMLWGTICLFVTELNKLGASTQLISFLRTASSFAVLFAFSVVKGKLKHYRITRRAFLACLFFGIFCEGAFNFCYTSAINLSGPTIACILMNLAPLFTALAAVIMFKEKLTGPKIIAIVINVIGCTLASTGGVFEIDALAIAGIIFGVLAGLLYGLSATVIKVASNNNADGVVISVYGYLLGTLTLLFPLQESDWAMLSDWRILVTGLLYGTAATAIPSCIYIMGIQRLRENSKVTLFGTVEIIVTALLGRFVLNDELNWISIIGIFIVLGSIALMGLAPEDKAKNPKRLPDNQ